VEKDLNIDAIMRMAEKNRIEAIRELNPDTQIDHYFTLTDEQRKKKIKKGAGESSWQ
jgi:hypothetical protein